MTGGDRRDYHLARIREATHPNGTWAQRWIPGVCRHHSTRCTHGDEVNYRGGARRACLTCGRSLPGPPPATCYYTGAPHRALSTTYTPNPTSRRGAR